MDRYPWREKMLFMFFIYLFDLYSCSKKLSLRDMVVLIINPARDLHNLFFRAFMLTSSLKHKVYQILNKRREGQSRMNNPETLATLDTQTQKHNTSQETSHVLVKGKESLSLFKSRYLSKYEQHPILCTPNYCRES